MVGPIPVRTAQAPLVEWRPGVRTRLHTVAGAEPSSLCLMEQWCDPGLGAPTHTHFDVEEVIAIVAGEAELWCDDSTIALSAGDSILIPPHSRHGFRNAGETTLHIFAVFGTAASSSLLRGGARHDLRDRRAQLRDA